MLGNSSRQRHRHRHRRDRSRPADSCRPRRSHHPPSRFGSMPAMYGSSSSAITSLLSAAR